MAARYHSLAIAREGFPEEALKVTALKNIKRDYAQQTENISIGKIDSLCSGSEDSATMLLKQDAGGDYGDDDVDGDGSAAAALMAPAAVAADAFAIDLDSAHFRALRTVNLQLEIVENVFCKSRSSLLAKVCTRVASCLSPLERAHVAHSFFNLTFGGGGQQERAGKFGAVLMPSHWKTDAPAPPRKHWTRAFLQVERTGSVVVVKATLFNKLPGTNARDELIARPLVLRADEVQLMANAPSDFLVKRLAAFTNRAEDAIRQRGVWVNIAEYAFFFAHFVPCGNGWSAGTPDVDEDGGHDDVDNASLALAPPLSTWRVALPVPEYWRLERDALREREYSIRLLQRMIRGTRARTLANRLLFRSQMKDKYRRKTERTRDTLQDLRRRRDTAAARIVAIYRGWSWRRRLAVMKDAAVRVQCAFRIYRAKKKVFAERMRKTLGPPVEIIFTRTAVIAGLDLSLSVFRCGDNYKVRASKKIKPSLAALELRRKQKRAGVSSGNASAAGRGVREYVAIEGSVFADDVTRLLEVRRALDSHREHRHRPLISPSSHPPLFRPTTDM